MSGIPTPREAEVSVSISAQAFIAICYIYDADTQQFVAFQGRRLALCIPIKPDFFVHLYSRL